MPVSAVPDPLAVPVTSPDPRQLSPTPELATAQVPARRAPLSESLVLTTLSVPGPTSRLRMYAPRERVEEESVPPRMMGSGLGAVMVRSEAMEVVEAAWMG